VSARISHNPRFEVRLPTAYDIIQGAQIPDPGVLKETAQESKLPP
jgi:hypothetical protein